MELLERKLPFLNTLLKGVGQIILQENALTGLLFFLGIFYWSILMGLGAVLVVLVLVTWALIYISHHIYSIAASEMLTAETHITNDFTFALRGFGKVIFQGSAISGIIFFIAVFINSPISALYGIAGAILAATLSALFSAPTDAIEMRLFSYNAVLCAIVFAGDKPKDSAFTAVAVILSVFIAFLINKFNLIQLTFPFVVATCITLAVKNLNIKQRLEQTITD